MPPQTANIRIFYLFSLSHYQPAVLLQKKRQLVDYLSELSTGNRSVLELYSPKILHGRYRVVSELPHHMLGTLHHVIDEQTGEELLLKTSSAVHPIPPKLSNTLLPEKVIDETVRFRQEFDLRKNISTPYLVPVCELQVQAEKPYFTMECPGTVTLSGILERSPEPLPLPWCIRILDELSNLLIGLHEQQIVHRNLNCESLLVLQIGELPTVRAVALDLAFFDAVVPTAGTWHETRLLATPYTASPEQINGEPLDLRSDIYSFGAIAFRVLTGGFLFGEATSSRSMMVRQLAEPAPLPSAYRPGIPAWLDSLVVSCLMKERENRPSSARELLQILRSQKAPPRQLIKLKAALLDDSFNRFSVRLAYSESAKKGHPLLDAVKSPRLKRQIKRIYYGSAKIRECLTAIRNGILELISRFRDQHDN